MCNFIEKIIFNILEYTSCLKIYLIFFNKPFKIKKNGNFTIKISYLFTYDYALLESYIKMLYLLKARKIIFCIFIYYHAILIYDNVIY